MPYQDEYEARRARTRGQRTNQRHWEKNREVVGRLWDKPPVGAKAAKPRSAGEALYSTSKAKLLDDHQRGSVSRLGNTSKGWWGENLSKTQVERMRKGR
jgi:hypothetical protein